MSREIIMVLVFAAATLLGYRLISAVPSLLHTPLMSGMNALSGVTVLGAVTATALALGFGSKVLGVLAIICATINLAGGFLVTNRMLSMFKDKKEDQADEEDRT